MGQLLEKRTYATVFFQLFLTESNPCSPSPPICCWSKTNFTYISLTKSNRMYLVQRGSVTKDEIRLIPLEIGQSHACKIS